MTTLRPPLTARCCLLLLLCAVLAACDDSSPGADTGPGPLDRGPSVDARPDRGPGGDGPAADAPLPADLGPDQAQSPDQALTPDLPPPKPDLAAADASSQSDITTYFPKVLDGIWLVGWSGGANHFSWIRFSVSSSAGGKADLLDGAGMFGNVPLWSCSGATTWNTSTSTPFTVQVQWPSTACNGYRSSHFTFANFKQPGIYPKGAILRADVTISTATGIQTAAFKYPASQCNAAMTSCKDPL